MLKLFVRRAKGCLIAPIHSLCEQAGNILHWAGGSRVQHWRAGQYLKAHRYFHRAHGVNIFSLSHDQWEKEFRRLELWVQQNHHALDLFHVLRLLAEQIGLEPYFSHEARSKMEISTESDPLSPDVSVKPEQELETTS